MEKIKDFYKTNRVYVILMAISVFCVTLILGVLVYYFISQNNTSTYGNRLNGVESVEITKDKLSEAKRLLEENENIDNASLRIVGKIVYINIYLKENKVSDSKALAIKILDVFGEDQKEVYDIAFTISLVGDNKDTIFPIMGSKKSDNTIISWTNHSE